MADRIKGITIEIGGDTTNLQKSLAGVNKDLKSTQSQLRDVEKLLKLDPKNVELLRQKQKLLNDAVAESNEKLEKLHEAEKALKDSGIDENSEQFMALRREIVATEQQMQQYQKEAEKGADATEEAGDAAEEASDKTGGLSTALKAAGAAFGAMATAAAAAAVGVGKALADAALNGAAFADEIMTQSVVTGISTEKLQELAYSAELVDVSVDTISGALKKNTAAMLKASEGSGDAADAFASLGISVTNADGSLRNSEAVFWETIDALGNIENETERDALAMSILGKSATELNPLIAAGSAKMAELAEEAHAAGYVLDEETLDAFGNLDDQMQRMKNGATAAKNALGTILLPTLTQLGEDGTGLLNKFTTELLEADGDVQQLPGIIASLVPNIVDAITQTVPDLAAGALEILFAIVDSVVDNLPALLDAVVPVLVDLIESLIARLPDIIDAVIKVAVALAEAIADALPDLIPALVDAIFEIVDLLLKPETLTTILGAALKLMGAIIVGVIKATPKLLEDLGSTIWSFFDNLFNPDTSKWSDGFKGIINKMISGINTVIAKPFESLNNVLTKIRDINILGAKPFDWVKSIPVPKIPMLATGGILSSGSAIVGEAGPELLTNVGGRSVVQPLTASVDSVGLAKALHGAQQPIAISINYGGDLAQLGRLLSPSISAEGARLGASLA